MRRSSLFIAGGFVIASVALAGPAQAAQPDNANCWGVVSSQAARSSGGLGAHASSFDEPRLGIGNVAKAFGLSGPGELGVVLSGLDNDPTTAC